MIESCRTVNRSPAFVLAAFMLVTSACQAPIAADLLTQSGGVLYRDDFTDPTSGWGRNVTDNGTADYAGGGYRITIKTPGYDYWAVTGLTFTDVHIEVDALKIGGPEVNRIGLICRYRDNRNFYFLIVSSDGYYGIGKVKDGQVELLGQPQMQRTSAVHSGSASNHLRADCVADTLVLYVNDQAIGMASDMDFASGDVGILTGAFDEAGVDVLFDDFVVTKP
jgi:hypothetical protein